MKKTVAGLALICVTLNFACAPQMKGTPVHPPQAKGTATLDKSLSTDEKTKILKQWAVACDSGADCPDDVAQLIETKNGRLCTATLIAPDIMLTNSHCLQDDALSADDLCKTTKFVFADKSASGAESVACKAIVTKSDLVSGRFDKPDYMVIRLEHALQRKPLTITREGLKQHEMLTLHKIDPDTESGNGVLKTAHCKVLQGTAFLPGAIHDTDPVMITRDCSVIDGNSGSPLTNAKGELAAVVFASVDHDDVTMMMNALNGNIIEEKSERALRAHVTNLACLSLPSAPPIPTVCANTPGTAGVSAPNLDPKANWPAISAAVKVAWPAHKDLIEKKLGYRPAMSEDNGSVLFTGFCFNNSSTWLSQYARGAKLEASADLKTVIMKWNLSWTLNEDLKAIPRLTEVTAPDVFSVRFSPATLKASGASLVEDLSSGSRTTWKTCPAHATATK